MKSLPKRDVFLLMLLKALVIGVAYIDLDNFKYVNDTMGHEGGDLVLKEVARALAESTRGSDVMARMGGGESAGFFPETEFENATSLAAKLREKLLAVAYKNGWPVTFSMGLISFEKPPDTA